MKFLKKIDIDNVGDEIAKNYQQRRAARAVVFDADNRVALLHVTKESFHKLPGGGLEGEEDIISALRRECLEEIGCEIIVEQELGYILEYRTRWELRQESYCYLARVLGDKGVPHFSESEKAQGFEIIWLPLEEAIETVRNNQPTLYPGEIIQNRDLAFLEEAELAMKLSTKK